MLIAFVGMCVGLCLCIIPLPQVAASLDPFVEDLFFVGGDL